jgi:hypothetical protein
VLDPTELGKAAQGDQVAGREQLVLHVRYEVGAARDRHRLVPVDRQQVECFLEHGRPVVLVGMQTEHQVRTPAGVPSVAAIAASPAGSFAAS